MWSEACITRTSNILHKITLIGNYIFVLKCKMATFGEHLVLGQERIVLFSGSGQLPLINSPSTVAFVPWVCPCFPDTMEAQESE